MDPSELARLMLEWEMLERKISILETRIKNAVLEQGESLTVGNVRASYYSGRKSYDYQAAAKDAPQDIVAAFTTTPAPRVDWKGICEHLGKDEIPFTQSAPSVKVKLL